MEDTIQALLTPIEEMDTTPTREAEDFPVTTEVQSILPSYNSNTDYYIIKSAKDKNLKLLVNVFIEKITVFTMLDYTNHTTKISNKGR